VLLDQRRDRFDARDPLDLEAGVLGADVRIEPRFA
jgi:hypothetical protein